MTSLHFDDVLIDSKVVVVHRLREMAVKDVSAELWLIAIGYFLICFTATVNSGLKLLRISLSVLRNSIVTKVKRKTRWVDYVIESSVV